MINQDILDALQSATDTELFELYKTVSALEQIEREQEPESAEPAEHKPEPEPGVEPGGFTYLFYNSFAIYCFNAPQTFPKKQLTASSPLQNPRECRTRKTRFSLRSTR
jgi:hypothetical protein